MQGSPRMLSIGCISTALPNGSLGAVVQLRSWSFGLAPSLSHPLCFAGERETVSTGSSTGRIEARKQRKYGHIEAMFSLRSELKPSTIPGLRCTALVNAPCLHKYEQNSVLLA
jgi:hypothetical protein